MSDYNHGILADLRNGQIAFTGEFFNLLFLDNETLQIKTALSQKISSDTKFFSVFKDEKKNESLILQIKGIVSEFKQDKIGTYTTE